MNKEENTLKGRTKNIYEQIPFGIIFYMMNEISKPSCFESFATKNV